MRCYCCETEVSLARQVMLRAVVRLDPEVGNANSAAYTSFAEQMTYRPTFVCQRCYDLLDNEDGTATIRQPVFGIAPLSRMDKAPTIDE
jgi:hypothetical protein